jgi:hypothetical protein
MKMNNDISLQSLYLKTIKRQHIYSSIDDSEVVLVFECNNAGLKKLSSDSLSHPKRHVSFKACTQL